MEEISSQIWPNSSSLDRILIHVWHNLWKERKWKTFQHKDLFQAAVLIKYEINNSTLQLDQKANLYNLLVGFSSWNYIFIVLILLMGSPDRGHLMVVFFCNLFCFSFLLSNKNQGNFFGVLSKKWILHINSHDMR